MENKKKKSLDDIFEDDDFGLLESKEKTSSVKSEEDRLIDAFQEINLFVDKNDREPNAASMSEYGLLAKLKNFKQDESKKKILKPFDKHNLLGHVEMEKPSIDDILNEEDDLLSSDEEISIFKYKHIPKEDERAESDFVAKRKPMKDQEFQPYEAMFQKVHQELKAGKRKLLPFTDIEKHLQVNQFYISDGVLLYLQDVKFKREEANLSKETARRKDGRTTTIFENGTYSKMLYRSLGKQIQKNGKMVTNTYEDNQNQLFVNAGMVNEEDLPTGWIYVLKSKSQHPEISAIDNLYKIGFTSTPLIDRIKNAKKEATYLYADVQTIASYKCYNRNADKLELLLHRFFAEACLNIDIEIIKGNRITPREWFVVPFEEIEKAISLILNEEIVNFKYDTHSETIIPK